MVIFSVLLDFITSLPHISHFSLPLLSAHRCTQIWIYLFWSDFVHHFQTFMLHFPSDTVSTGSHHINPLVTNQLPQSAAEWCPQPHPNPIPTPLPLQKINAVDVNTAPWQAAAWNILCLHLPGSSVDKWDNITHGCVWWRHIKKKKKKKKLRSSHCSAVECWQGCHGSANQQAWL